MDFLLGPTVGRAAAVLLLLFSCLSYAGDKAPDFVLANSGGTMVSLADFRGKPLVLHFWASWCPYCKKLQPGLDRLQTQYREAGLVVLGISFREDEGVDPQAVLDDRKLHFTTLLYGEDVAKLYGVRGTPTTFFIDGKGRIAGMTHSSDPADPVLKSLAEKTL